MRASSHLVATKNDIVEDLEQQHSAMCAGRIVKFSPGVDRYFVVFDEPGIQPQWVKAIPSHLELLIGPDDVNSSISESYKQAENPLLGCQLCGLDHSGNTEMDSTEPNRDSFCFRECCTCKTKYHVDCMPNKVIDGYFSSNPWKCWKCSRCECCRKASIWTTPLLSWNLQFLDEQNPDRPLLVCGDCLYLFRTSKDFCPMCYKVYCDDVTKVNTEEKESTEKDVNHDRPFDLIDEDAMVQCNECSRWVHALCDGIDENQYQAITAGSHPVWGDEYLCPKCRVKISVNIVEQLKALDASKTFAEPVTEFVAKNYFDVIRNPMDLSKMATSAKRGYYKSLQSLRQDFELMCLNALIFNKKGDEYWAEARDYFENVTKEIFNKMQRRSVVTAYGIEIRELLERFLAEDSSNQVISGRQKKIRKLSNSTGPEKIDGDQSQPNPILCQLVNSSMETLDTSLPTSPGFQEIGILLPEELAKGVVPNSYFICSAQMLNSDEAFLLCSVDACILCGTSGSLSSFIFCVDCGEAFHSFCAEAPVATMSDAAVSTWRCGNCKICETCGDANEAESERLVYCESCDKAYHIDCLDPKLPKIPSSQWFCAACVSCKVGCLADESKCCWGESLNICFTCHSNSSSLNSQLQKEKLDEVVEQVDEKVTSKNIRDNSKNDQIACSNAHIRLRKELNSRLICKTCCSTCEDHDYLECRRCGIAFHHHCVLDTSSFHVKEVSCRDWICSFCDHELIQLNQSTHLGHSTTEINKTLSRISKIQRMRTLKKAIDRDNSLKSLNSLLKKSWLTKRRIFDIVSAMSYFDLRHDILSIEGATSASLLLSKVTQDSLPGITNSLPLYIVKCRSNRFNAHLRLKATRHRLKVHPSLADDSNKSLFFDIKLYLNHLLNNLFKESSSEQTIILSNRRAVLAAAFLYYSGLSRGKEELNQTDLKNAIGLFLAKSESQENSMSTSLMLLDYEPSATINANDRQYIQTRPKYREIASEVNNLVNSFVCGPIGLKEQQIPDDFVSGKLMLSGSTLKYPHWIPGGDSKFNCNSIESVKNKLTNSHPDKLHLLKSFNKKKGSTLHKKETPDCPTSDTIKHNKIESETNIGAADIKDIPKDEKDEPKVSMVPKIQQIEPAFQDGFYERKRLIYTRASSSNTSTFYSSSSNFADIPKEIAEAIDTAKAESFVPNKELEELATQHLEQNKKLPSQNIEFSDEHVVKASLSGVIPLRGWNQEVGGSIGQWLDPRYCCLCYERGDSDDLGRLLAFSEDLGYVHTNCIRYGEVIETKGVLIGSIEARRKAKQSRCSLCHEKGASAKCCKSGCRRTYHIRCARKAQCVFLESKLRCEKNDEPHSIYCLVVCPEHHVSLEKYPHATNTSSNDASRLLLLEDRFTSDSQDLADVLSQRRTDVSVRSGAAVIHALGVVQADIQGFHSTNYIYPYRFRSSRIFWSMNCIGLRACYIMEILRESDVLALLNSKNTVVTENEGVKINLQSRSISDVLLTSRQKYQLDLKQLDTLKRVGIDYAPTDLDSINSESEHKIDRPIFQISWFEIPTEGSSNRSNAVLEQPMYTLSLDEAYNTIVARVLSLRVKTDASFRLREKYNAYGLNAHQFFGLSLPFARHAIERLPESVAAMICPPPNQYLPSFRLPTPEIVVRMQQWLTTSRKASSDRVSISGCVRADRIDRHHSKLGKKQFTRILTKSVGGNEGPQALAKGDSLETETDLLVDEEEQKEMQRMESYNYRVLASSYQLDPNANLLVRKSHIHGYGLFAKTPFNRHDMIIEYIGQKVRQTVADRREVMYEEEGVGSCYLFRQGKDAIIDATRIGGMARFINHCCEPNAYAKIVSITKQSENSEDVSLQDLIGEVVEDNHIIIMAARDIEAGEEITYDYKFPIEDNKLKCYCSATKCLGFMN